MPCWTQFLAIKPCRPYTDHVHEKTKSKQLTEKGGGGGGGCLGLFVRYHLKIYCLSTKSVKFPYLLSLYMMQQLGMTMGVYMSMLCVYFFVGLIVGGEVEGFQLRTLIFHL